MLCTHIMHSSRTHARTHEIATRARNDVWDSPALQICDMMGGDTETISFITIASALPQAYCTWCSRFIPRISSFTINSVYRLTEKELCFALYIVCVLCHARYIGRKKSRANMLDLSSMSVKEKYGTFASRKVQSDSCDWLIFTVLWANPKTVVKCFHVSQSFIVAMRMCVGNFRSA